MPIIIQGYLEGYKLSYTIDGYTSIVANSANIYQFQLKKENIDQTIWDNTKYTNKVISFNNTTSEVLESRILNEVDSFYYVNIPSSVLTVKGRLYVTINFYNDENGIVTKKMDNPIFIAASENALPPSEQEIKLIREEITFDNNSITLSSDIIYIDGYEKLLQVFLDGKLLSTEDYTIKDKILTISDSITPAGQKITLLLQIPCDCGDSGVIADYADEANRLSNKLIIGDIVYDGSQTVTLPSMPKAVIYNEKQNLLLAEQKMARSNISAPKVFLSDENSIKIWIKQDESLQGEQIPLLDGETEEDKREKYIFENLEDFRDPILNPVQVKINNSIISQNLYTIDNNTITIIVFIKDYPQIEKIEVIQHIISETPNIGDIWIIPDNDENIVALPKIEPGHDEGKVLTVRGNEWIADKLPITEHDYLPKVTLNDEEKVLQVNNGEWTTTDIKERLLPDLSEVFATEAVVYTAVPVGDKYEWNFKQPKELFTPKFLTCTLSPDTETEKKWEYYEEEGCFRQAVLVSAMTNDSVLLATPHSGSYLLWAGNSVHLEKYGDGQLIFKSFSNPQGIITVNVVYFGEKTQLNTLMVD